MTIHWVLLPFSLPLPSISCLHKHGSHVGLGFPDIPRLDLGHAALFPAVPKSFLPVALDETPLDICEGARSRLLFQPCPTKSHPCRLPASNVLHQPNGAALHCSCPWCDTAAWACRGCGVCATITTTHTTAHMSWLILAQASVIRVLITTFVVY